jgi:sugar lactone lactonase YvrE
MIRSPRLGLVLSLTVGLALSATLVSAAPATSPRTDRFPDRIELPDAFLPEGIAIGHGPTAWFGSRADGDIYQANLRTGEGEIISQGPGTPSVGLKVDHRRRLFVAGGPAGDGRVVGVRSGEILESYQFTELPSFVNDVLLTKRAAWFTDSMQPQLYALPLTKGGRLPDQADVVTLALKGDWEQGAGFGANGISDTPNHRALLVVHSTSGILYRVNPWTGRATAVDLGGRLLTNGDGLLREGRILYVVQNRLNQIAAFELNKPGTNGRLIATITSPDFDVPTTVASFGRWLYLPNARFTTTPMPDTAYWVSRVRALAGGC